jgi:hypothetical protein
MFTDTLSVVSKIKYANMVMTWGFKTPSHWLPTCGPPISVVRGDYCKRSADIQWTLELRTV